MGRIEALFVPENQCCRLQSVLCWLYKRGSVDTMESLAIILCSIHGPRLNIRSYLAIPHLQENVNQCIFVFQQIVSGLHPWCCYQCHVLDRTLVRNLLLIAQRTSWSRGMSSYFLRGHTGLASNADILPTLQPGRWVLAWRNSKFLVSGRRSGRYILFGPQGTFETHLLPVLLRDFYTQNRVDRTRAQT